MGRYNNLKQAYTLHRDSEYGSKHCSRMKGQEGTEVEEFSQLFTDMCV